VLIIVLWVAFGLVSITLYFAHSMLMNLKAADNHTAGIEADQAIEGAALYVSNILANRANMMSIPSTANYRANAVKIGDAKFWLVGRDTNDLQSSGQADAPFWGLVDEAAKVNINYTDPSNLLNLPNVSLNLAAAMNDWRTTSTTPSTFGAKSETYSALPTPYLCKDAPYETVEELSLVYNMNMDILFGEDANLNGILDPNENDGMTLPPADNQNGILDPGVLEYVTVWSYDSTLGTNGTTRIAVNNTSALQTFFQTNSPNMLQYLTSALGSGRSRSGTSSGGSSRGGGSGGSGSGGGGGASTPPTSVLDLYYKMHNAGMSESDFQQVEPYLKNPTNTGLINVTTATATALACVPGIGSNLAPQVLAYRQANPLLVPSITWLVTALNNDVNAIETAGPNVTPYSFQFAADIVAVGHNNRGYRRVRFIFDCGSGTPLVVFRQDLTHLGWPLGRKLHDQLLAENSK
jgi:DNA uptake protein ComE-like DNA-binding protein